MTKATEATAIAHPNIALAKYWGKRADGHNLPAVPSLSVTLRGMATTTTVAFDTALGADTFSLNGDPVTDAPLRRVSGLLDRVRKRAGISTYARVTSSNDFPTASGLASSASAFAALAVAAARAAGLALTPSELSNLARETSVSSARSVLGGFVELPRGEAGQTFLAAEVVAPTTHWDLSVVVAVTREGPKDVGSSEGMAHTAATSPYFPGWVESAPATFAAVRAALVARDFEALGVAAEHSALAMHAAAIAARPGVLYWTGATVDAIAGVKRLRAAGLPAYATIDAGPHVKVITRRAHAEEIASRMREVPGVLRTIVTEPGEGARVVEA